MKPAWDQLAGKLANAKHVQIADVDCTAQQNQGLCQQQGVQGYPTIKYYVKGSKSGKPYQGGRDYNSLYGFVRKQASIRKKKEAKAAEDAMDIDAVLAKMKDTATNEQIGKAFVSWVETSRDADPNMKKMLKAFEALKTMPDGYNMMGEVVIQFFREKVDRSDPASRRAVNSYAKHLDKMVAEKQEL